MKKMKRLLATVLSVAMIAGLFAVIEPEKAEAAMPTTEYFNETFSTDGAFDNDVWSSNNTANLVSWKEAVADGKLTIPSDSNSVYLMVNDAGLITQSDYTVSCDVQLSQKPINTAVYAGLVARTTNEGTEGYEFQLVIPVDDSLPYVRIRDRAASANFTGIERLEDLDYINEPVNMKMVCVGKSIRCYINDVEVLTYEVSETATYINSEDIATVYSAGTVGFRSPRTASADTSTYIDVGATMSVDNFNVSRAEKFSDDFNQYDSTATSSEKKEALIANGWYVPDNKTANNLSNSAYIIPNDNADIVIVRTENAKGALGWNDYSVQANVKIGDTDDTLSNAIQVSVTGRHTSSSGSDGYEIELYRSDGGSCQLRIRKRAVQPETLKTCEFEFVAGITYKLQAVFQGNRIYAYVNDVLYLMAEDDTYPIGFAGICKRSSAAGVDITVDDFAVYDYDAAGQVEFYETFDTYENLDSGSVNRTAMESNGWYVRSNGNGNCNTGSNMLIPSTQTFRINTSGVEGTSEWKNYVVECDFDFVNITDTTEIDGDRYLYITCRESTDGTGYGFCVRTTKGNGVRQVYFVKFTTDSSNKLTYTTVGTARSVASGDRWPFGDMLTIRLEANERTLTGYVVEYEELTKCTYTIPDEEEVTGGYAGVQVNGHSSYLYNSVIIDDFQVYTPGYVRELVGDVLVDDIVNEYDVEAVRDYLKNGSLAGETSETYNVEAVDVNKDDAMNIKDYVRMMRLVDSLQ